MFRVADPLVRAGIVYRHFECKIYMVMIGYNGAWAQHSLISVCGKHEEIPKKSTLSFSLASGSVYEIRN